MALLRYAGGPVCLADGTSGLPRASELLWQDGRLYLRTYLRGCEPWGGPPCDITEPVPMEA